MKKIILVLSIFVISSSYLFSFDQGISASLGFTESINAVYTAPFTTKIQWETRIDFKFHFPLGTTLFIVTGGNFDIVCPSDYSGAYYYRGYKGGGIDIGLGLRFSSAAGERNGDTPGGRVQTGSEEASPPLSTAFGAVLGGNFTFSVYDHTYQLFFYPSVYLSPFFDLRFTQASFFFLRFSVLLRIAFRRDLDHSSSYGIGISAVFDLEKMGGGSEED